MGLDQFADTIMDISSAASNELSIEKAIEAIAEQWVDLKLEIDTYKDRGHYRLKWVPLPTGWWNGHAQLVECDLGWKAEADAAYDRKGSKFICQSMKFIKIYKWFGIFIWRV